MDIDQQPLGPVHRKRALTPSDDELEQDDIVSSPHSGKRPRHTERSIDPHIISPRDAIIFNAACMLQDLAFTQFYVTANYSSFSPYESLVLLYLNPRIASHYTSVCDTLPNLYLASPKLQALAVQASTIDEMDDGLPEDMVSAISRALPIVQGSEDLERLVRELATQGLTTSDSYIVVVDCNQKCRYVQQVWDDRFNCSPNEAAHTLGTTLTSVCSALESERSARAQGMT